MDDKPWRSLPRSLAAVVRPELPALADEILAALRERVPDYDRPLRGEFGRGIRHGVEDALSEFLSLMGDPEGREPDPRVYHALGRGEHQAGRSLDALQSAYRVGARVAWRRTSVLAEQAGVDPEHQRLLAEAIFAYIDRLASFSVAGYAEAHATQAGELQRRRRQLAQLLLSREPVAASALAAAAAEASWTLPRTAAAVVLAPGIEPTRIAGRIGPDVLVTEDGALVVPDPEAPGSGGRLATALEGARAAAGPALPLRDLPASLRWARRALALVGAGGPETREEAGMAASGPQSVVFADAHLAELAVTADPALVRRLADRVLSPLDALPGARGDRLAETLSAWLRAHGHRPTVAAMLHVHPQTVRYRLARLRELYGDRLDDPEERFALELALRGRLMVQNPDQ